MAFAWPLAEQLAALYLHLGRPAEARATWLHATDCPSAALRTCREAETFWVQRRFDEALDCLSRARREDPHLPEAVWALATLNAEMGNAGATRSACEAGLQLSLTERQRADLQVLLALVPH